MTDLENRFMYHQVNNEQAQRMAKMRTKLLELAQEFETNAPVCRERSLAVTKLEEAMMWFNAAIARHE